MPDVVESVGPDLGSRPVQLLELLEASCSGRGMVRFMPDHPTPRPLAHLWRDSETAARWLSARIPEGGCAAAVLATSPTCLAALVGAWRAGLTVASLPTPARGMRSGDYQCQVAQICAQTGADLLLVDDAYLAMLPPMTVPVVGYGECAAGAAGGRVDCVGDFVQFTSGSTRSPKGVRLDLCAVAANVLSMAVALEPIPGDVVCSWLPLSHDMGLFGLCLTPWVAASPEIAGAGTLCLIRPEAFARRPSVWLQTCSDIAATITAAPSFALHLAARAIITDEHLDLHRLRVCVTGADMVRADTLRAFSRATRNSGFSDRAFCPAYGLAEATLAVTMVRPEEHWSARRVDPLRLAKGEWCEIDDHGLSREVVSTGRPIPGMRVRAGNPHAGPASIEVTGPSLLTDYIGEERAPIKDGWLTTSDLGCLVDGELLITGRHHDLLVVAGQNYYAADIENIINSDSNFGARNAVALADEADRYLVVVEAGRRTPLPDLANRLRATLVERLGAGPSSVRFVTAGSLPKTPSGKLQRHRVRAQLAAGKLSDIAEFDFRRGT